MPKLLSSKQIIKILENHNFIFVSQNGSHMKYRKNNGKALNTIVPANKREIPIGTLRSIIRQSGLTLEDFGI